MRMRKKKNGDRRLAECGALIVRSRADLPDLPVSLEIGCGKGGFICRMAERYPDRQFVCVEICSDVAVLAAERVARLGLRNVHFIVGDAKDLGSFFEKGDVERIFLNFSDPWTKSGQYKRRLTYRAFLFVYKSILRDGASVFFKRTTNGFLIFRSTSSPLRGSSFTASRAICTRANSPPTT